ncbi:MAG: 3-oxoacyl-ACP reductase [Pseudomonadota bacterium]
MSDLLQNLNRNPLTSPLVKALGLPDPITLARAPAGYKAQPFTGKTALLLAAAGGYAAESLRSVLSDAGADVVEALPEGETRADLVVMDATGCRTPADYRALYGGFHPVMRRIAKNGRVLIAAAIPEVAADPVAAAVARGMEGFSRSLGKELGAKGITVNLAHVATDATDRLAQVVRFFGGVQTTYVSGQVVHVTARVAAPAELPTSQVLKGKVALVTGSARGIGYATAQRLVQEGATVVCLDIPQMTEALHKSCTQIGAIPLALDISSPEAPRKLADLFKSKFGGIDIVVHNAGITRDKTLANMKEQHWDQVISINFAAIVAADAVLLGEGVLREGGRIVCLSSISGVAGNFGQTNYAASKAALIGYVAAQAPLLAKRGICINAIAPGFITTPMTDAMPFATREVGARLNSVKQAGMPRDAAELIAFLASPGAYGISGDTVRVCGQGLIGA